MSSPSQRTSSAWNAPVWTTIPTVWYSLMAEKRVALSVHLRHPNCATAKTCDDQSRKERSWISRMWPKPVQAIGPSKTITRAAVFGYVQLCWKSGWGLKKQYTPIKSDILVESCSLHYKTFWQTLILKNNKHKKHGMKEGRQGSLAYLLQCMVALATLQVYQVLVTRASTLMNCSQASMMSRPIQALFQPKWERKGQV